MAEQDIQVPTGQSRRAYLMAEGANLKGGDQTLCYQLSAIINEIFLVRMNYGDMLAVDGGWRLD